MIPKSRLHIVYNQSFFILQEFLMNCNTKRWMLRVQKTYLMVRVTPAGKTENLLIYLFLLNRALHLGHGLRWVGDCRSLHKRWWKHWKETHFSYRTSRKSTSHSLVFSFYKGIWQPRRHNSYRYKTWRMRLIFQSYIDLKFFRVV